MTEGYQNLPLPSGIPPELAKLIRERLEPQLADVHAMLRLPIKSDPGLGAGCNLAAAQVLLSVISGVSVNVYDPSALTRRGDRGQLFREVVEKNYPWDEEQHIAGARLNKELADDLYKFFRNPLAHTLGVVDSQDNPLGQHVVIEKGSIPEADIVSDEMAIHRPTDWQNPTLRQQDNELVLWVRSFYYGVRRMICNAASARIQTTQSVSTRMEATQSVPGYIIPGQPTEWRST